MTASMEIRLGRRIPAALLAEFVDGEIRPVLASDVFARTRGIIIGAPGAFTPVCSEQHVPELIAGADRLRASGFDMVACIVASDPFVMDAWARTIDPDRKIRFFSDGNLSFARAFGLVTREPEFFLGDRSERYLMSVRNGVIDAFRVERNLTQYTCTNADDFVLEDV